MKQGLEPLLPASWITICKVPPLWGTRTPKTLKVNAALRETLAKTEAETDDSRDGARRQEAATNLYTVVPELIDSKMTPQGLGLGAAVGVSGVHDIPPSYFTKVNPIYIVQH